MAVRGLTHRTSEASWLQSNSTPCRYRCFPVMSTATVAPKGQSRFSVLDFMKSLNSINLRNIISTDRFEWKPHGSHHTMSISLFLQFLIFIYEVKIQLNLWKKIYTLACNKTKIVCSCRRHFPIRIFIFQEALGGNKGKATEELTSVGFTEHYITHGEPGTSSFSPLTKFHEKLRSKHTSVHRHPWSLKAIHTM